MRLRYLLSCVWIAAAACLIGAAAPALWAQPCQPYWAHGSPLASTTGGNIVAFDDGSGAALYGIWTRSQHIFRWGDGDPQWTPFDSGLPSEYFIYWMRVLDDGSGPHLCAMGTNHTDPTHVVYWIARWTGSEWEFPWPSALWTNALPEFSADLGDGPAIYGATIDNNRVTIAKWTGNHWIPLGGPLDFYTYNLFVFEEEAGPTLYVSGGFSMIGNIPVPQHFARWRNQQWEPVGNGQTLGSPLVAYDDGSGSAMYTTAGYIGAQGVRGLLKFDGQEWVLVGEMDPPGAIYTLNAITVFDDGRGPAIYLGGGFSNMGGVPAHGIARYGRDGWSAVGDGVHNGSISFMASMPTPRGPSLFMTGGFTTAGGGSVMYTARLVGCPSCYANCDQSTAAPTLNVNDFLCFMTNFALHAPEANCTNDATIDIADFMCFMQRFAAGCP
jgi:hypothetical protein